MKETESIRERNIQSDALGVRSPDLIPDFAAAILRDSWQVNSPVCSLPALLSSLLNELLAAQARHCL